MACRNFSARVYGSCLVATLRSFAQQNAEFTASLRHATARRTNPRATVPTGKHALAVRSDGTPRIGRDRSPARLTITDRPAFNGVRDLITFENCLGQRKKPANGGLLADLVGEISRDWTGWLGREDSNLRMAESKSAALPLGYAPKPDRRETRGEKPVSHVGRRDHSGAPVLNQRPLADNIHPLTATLCQTPRRG